MGIAVQLYLQLFYCAFRHSSIINMNIQESIAVDAKI